jgi:5-carboxymethyl-2-hydroxymuconic-semialdehyde dehydrogenase
MSTESAVLAPAVPAGVPSLLTHYIDGAPRGSADGAVFAALEPVTNRAYTEVAAGGPADIADAVAAARRAFGTGPWPGLRAHERARVLTRIAEGIEARDDLIAEYESFDSGLPISQTRGQARRAAENFRFFADVITTLGEEVYRVGATQLNYVVRVPVGVAGLITPWNTPFMLETWKLAPSLAAGCTVVLKPAEWSPLSASLLPGILAEAGVPDGVFNLVHGDGEVAGAALVEHPDVPLISFTGETTTGQTIMRNASARLKGLSMELGGKSPCVVFADADLDRALDGALFGVFSLNGERCTAGSRVLVQRPVYEEFTARLADRAARIRVGPPADPRTELGALIHPEHYQRVRGYIAIGVAEGARLVTGGTRPDGVPGGNFLTATVFADVRPEMRVFQEEIFGPVVCVTPFDTEEEAVALANATRYGLATYIWTDNLRRGHRVAHRIESGMTWLNSHNVRDLRTPFGGVKASGLGREGGTHSIDFYTHSRTVHVALEDHDVPRFGLGD